MGDIYELKRRIEAARASRLRTVDTGNERAEAVENWYASRIERLRDLLRGSEFEGPLATILANGTAASGEPPTYAQKLNTLQARVTKLERYELAFKALEALVLGSGDGPRASVLVEFKEKVRRYRVDVEVLADVPGFCVESASFAEALVALGAARAGDSLIVDRKGKVVCNECEGHGCSWCRGPRVA